MAVDTRQKRFSMMSTVAMSLVFLPVFEADGGVDLDDRQHLLNRYSGIAFGGAVEPAVGSGSAVFIRDPSRQNVAAVLAELDDDCMMCLLGMGV